MAFKFELNLHSHLDKVQCRKMGQRVLNILLKGE